MEISEITKFYKNVENLTLKELTNPKIVSKLIDLEKLLWNIKTSYRMPRGIIDLRTSWDLEKIRSLRKKLEEKK